MTNRRSLFGHAVIDAFKKLDPRHMVRNPVMFVVEIGSLLTNRLLVYDGLNMAFTEFKLRKNSACDHCGPVRASKT